ncbi:MAG TPA: lysoplasmalogenase [Acidimicrobiales bacterium]|nr:lysoplasmalogenase [Acidimicrobiales bacterium]
MTTGALILLALAGAAAVADWVAVWRRPSPIENLLKPLVLVLLVATALAVDPVDDGQRAWFVVALVLSLAGDVFLLPAVDRFVPGLASFLLAHVAYIVGLTRDAGTPAPAVAVVLLVPVAMRVIGAVRHREPELLAPVVVYITVIAAMVAMALRSGDVVAAAGAVTFATSDSILALDRFDRHRRWMPLAVMVTYHVAQALLVVSLL